MARLPRYPALGMPQHVIQRGNNRSPMFVEKEDYRFFAACLRDACERHGCVVHAYVFMTNHVHLLLTQKSVGSIGKVMQAVGRRYVLRFNKVHQRTGALWEGRYRATLIDTESYLFACHRYIELNPVRAGLARTASAYRWSSFGANALGAEDALVTPHECYTALGNDADVRQTAYRAMFDEPLNDSLVDEIRDATNRGWVLGSKPFRDAIAARLGRRSEALKRGRRSRYFDAI